MTAKLTLISVLILGCISYGFCMKGKGNRPKPWERAKLERQKDLFWFKVTEDDTEACSGVVEANVNIIAGPPGDSCQVRNNIKRCKCILISMHQEMLLVSS